MSHVKQALQNEADIDHFFASDASGMVTISHEQIHRRKVTAVYTGLRAMKKNGKSSIVYEYLSPVTSTQKRVKLGDWRLNGMNLTAAKLIHVELAGLVAVGRCPATERTQDRTQRATIRDAERNERLERDARRFQTFDQYFEHWTKRQLSLHASTKGTERKAGFSDSRARGYAGMWRKWGAPLHRCHVSIMTPVVLRFFIKCMSGAAIDAADWPTIPGTRRRDVDALPFLQSIQLVEVDGQHFAKPYATTAAGTASDKLAGADVCRNMITTLRGIHAEAITRGEDQLADMQPMPPLKSKDNPNGIDFDFLITTRRKGREWSIPEVIAFFRACWNEWSMDNITDPEIDEQHRMALLLILMTGCRKSEVGEAQRSWFRIRPGYMVIPETKNGDSHAVFITPQIVAVLKQVQALGIQSIDRLLPNVNNGTLNTRVSRVQGMIGSEQHIWPHALRSAFVRVALACGVAPTAIDACLNHRSSEVSAVGREHYGVKEDQAVLDDCWLRVGEFFQRYGIDGEDWVERKEDAAPVADLSFMF